jgi:phytol kinase
VTVVPLFLTISTVFALLVINELWWRKRDVHGELSRKFVHVTVGSFVAFWPFYLTWQQIELLSIAFFLGVLVSKYFKIFQAIHSVQRVTWGEMFFALSIGLVALITHNKWIYAAAILQMALADGLAAIIGLKYGKSQNYRIFSHTKSVIGTLAFFFVSIIILLCLTAVSNIQLDWGWIVLASGLACVFENIAVFGLDNLLVPVVVALLLVNH